MPGANTFSIPTVTAQGGQRQSTATVHLERAKQRRTFDLQLQSPVTKIIMEEDGSEECNDDYCTPSVGQYFLASGGESCDAACAAQGKECDLTAITDAAQSVDHCKAVLTDLGMAYQSSGMYPDDDSGCTYHPGQTGWAQVMHTGRDQGTAPAPTWPRATLACTSSQTDRRPPSRTASPASPSARAT